jgi:signal transduction histidine kinase
MAGVATAYVVGVPKKSRATRWLAATLFFNGWFSLSYFLSVSVTGGLMWEFRFSLLLYLGILLSVLSGLQLAYTFLARPYRREHRVARGLSAAVAAGMTAWTAWSFGGTTLLAWRALLITNATLLLVGTGWTLAVLARKAVRYRRLAERTPERAGRCRRIARAHRALFGLTAVILALAVVNLLVTGGAVPFPVLQYGSLLGLLVVDLGLVIVFISYAPEPTTAEAKLVGLGVATVLLFLGLASLQGLQAEELAAEAGNVLPPRFAVRAVPDGAGGYRVAERPFALHDAAGADTVALDINATEVPLPFAFPFGGRRYTRLYAYPAPLVSFAPLAEQFGWLEAVEHPAPKLIAFALPAEEPVTVALDARPDRAVFTWRPRDLLGRPTTHQLTLFPDGAFEMAYAGPEQHAFGGGAGFDPGPGPTRPVALPRALPVRVPAGTALVDDYEARYRPLAHERSRRFAALVLLGTAFVLVFFPRFLRSGFLRPLARLLTGVEELELGHREARVPVQGNDEFSALGRAFNRMAGSIQQAEAELLAYAQTLEERVAERTAALAQSNRELEAQRAALERSLRELEAAQGQLVQAEKLASLGRLTAGIAHEIKNPLNFVNNFALLNVDLADELVGELAAFGQRPDGAPPGLRDLLDDLRRNAAKIAEHGRRADRIVQGMLLHARGAPGEKEPADLNALLRLAADGFRSIAADRAVAFELDLDEAVGTVPVVTEAFVQVVVNLLDNAFYAAAHVPAEGDGSAPLTTGGASPRVVLRSRRRGDAVEIVVEDTGTGMTAETCARVFEPFFTTKPPGEGIGLGLSLAYDIVTESHGGTITASSSPGEGTTFVVTLPG